jgi:protein-L-isoaspartate(D-aspartate) O-methyltransferase
VSRPAARPRVSSGIRDRRVLDAVAAVPRELFVPADLRARAAEDAALPIAEGQTISQPTVVARMCELAAPQPGDRVLDVGTGSGYHAAVLAHLAGWVWSIERHEALSRGAARSLAAAGVVNVTLLVGDGGLGHEPAAPYDVINVAAAAGRRVPPALEAQLADGGRLVVPVARRGDERLVLVRRLGDRLERRALDRVRFVPLV